MPFALSASATLRITLSKDWYRILSKDLLINENGIAVKKLLIPIFCLFHISAIFWWTLPHSFGGMDLPGSEQRTVEAKLLNIAMLDDYPRVTTILQKYIDATGNQQYWDFFAPHSPKYHQYMSVCHLVIADPEQGKISCNGKAYFSNLDDNFQRFGSDRSRLYRLTENLAKLESPQLSEAFVHYYQNHDPEKTADNKPAQLVLHQFELHPELKDLPKSGYRMDKLIWGSH
jgi:hypothetical protein